MKSIPVILLAVFLAFSSSSSSEFYKWRDSNGNIVYSDSPPPGVDAEKITVREDRIERPKVKEEKTKPAEKTKATNKRPYHDIQVMLYMTTWCPYCRKAREYLTTMGVSLKEYDIEKDKAKHTEMLGKSGGSKGVPLIDIEGIIIKGYVPDAMKSAIEKRRGT